jgi:hypothetical protein
MVPMSAASDLRRTGAAPRSQTRSRRQGRDGHQFAQAITDGSEGLVCKSPGPDSACQAGARGGQWIKLKRDYRTELSDTADLAGLPVRLAPLLSRHGPAYGCALAVGPPAAAPHSRRQSANGWLCGHRAALPRRAHPAISHTTVTTTTAISPITRNVLSIAKI